MISAVNFIYIGLGGAAGACLRYSISLLLAEQLDRFPFSTLIANISGAFLAGFAATWLFSKGLLGTPLHLGLVVGLLGGFTTFSAFSVETLRLMESGNPTLAALNTALNVAGSLLAVFVGAALARAWA